jgi:multidrug resistance protein, MATE family
MPSVFTIWKAEVRSVLQLAGPLVFAEIGWMMMGIVDVMMVGRMPDSASGIGAVSIGGIVFYTVCLFVSGLLLGMDPLVSQAFGAGKIEECNRTLINSWYLVVPLSPLLMLMILACLPILRSAKVHPAVLGQIGPFLGALSWSVLPLLVWQAMRHYLQSLNHVKIIMGILISANLVNWLFNWLLIFGHWGFPALGVRGSGWATVISRAYMALGAAAFLVYIDRRDRLRLALTSRKVDPARIREIIRLGAPAAMQLGLELAVFAIAAVLIGKLGPIQIAAHQLAISVVAFTYMVPLGIGAAAAVRVGQALGRNDPRAAERAGWVAIAMGAAFMSLAAVVLIMAPHKILRLFTPDQSLITAGVSLLFIAALFQLFDGIQAVCTGALRGAGETRIPMFVFMLAYWVGGLPLGYFLTFRAGYGVRGLWIGFCFALISVGIVLLLVWRHKSRSFKKLRLDEIIEAQTLHCR